MKLMIPPLDSTIELSTPWKFTLFAGSGNIDLWNEAKNDNKKNTYWFQDGKYLDRSEITIARGTILKVKRIYVRRGMKSHDSVTFKIEKSKQFSKKHTFWVHLSDVNNLNFRNPSFNTKSIVYVCKNRECRVLATWNRRTCPVCKEKTNLRVEHMEVPWDDFLNFEQKVEFFTKQGYHLVCPSKYIEGERKMSTPVYSPEGRYEVEYEYPRRYE